ncbi:Methyltransferase-like protein 5 [Vitis vinifera]|uniref:Methyltransferase-like protein 5 n=1 Tax=Vitis vinifera TaxID=29760 RepID=A0A438DS89_VITVI|nr:Methyltransferase-like protein 5 [Vitis vinifera]
MKLKQLESFLGDLQQFSNPKVELEQYPTGPHIASRMLYTAENSFGDVSNKVVADFGCGCGTLGVAAALLGAEHVIGLDIDPQSLEIASLNAEDLELDMNFVHCDVKNLGWRGGFVLLNAILSQIVDTVVMNPPFGTRKKGADMDFLAVALKVASQAVYSLHKSSTRDNQTRTYLILTHPSQLSQALGVTPVGLLHAFGLFCFVPPMHVRKAALRNFNASSAEVLCELRYDVQQLYKFHKKKEVDIAVDLWRFVPQKDKLGGIIADESLR